MIDNTRPVGIIDLGGTKIYSAIVSGENRILGEDLRPTELYARPLRGYQANGRIIAVLREHRSGCTESLAGVGVAAPDR